MILRLVTQSHQPSSNEISIQAEISEQINLPPESGEQIITDGCHNENVEDQSNSYELNKPDSPIFGSLTPRTVESFLNQYPSPGHCQNSNDKNIKNCYSNSYYPNQQMYAPYEQHQSINLDNNINYD